MIRKSITWKTEREQGTELTKADTHLWRGSQSSMGWEVSS